MGGGGAGRLSSFMHLSGLSRAIKFLYAPAPLPPGMGLETSSWALHLLGLSLANICVCTRRYAGMHTFYAGMHTWPPQGRVGSCTVHKTAYAPIIQ
jgi:hypothetical protein